MMSTRHCCWAPPRHDQIAPEHCIHLPITRISRAHSFSSSFFHVPLYIREHWNGSLQTTQICVLNLDLDLTGPWLAACSVLLALPLLIFVPEEYVFQYFSVSERSALAAGGGFDDFPAAYLSYLACTVASGEASADFGIQLFPGLFSGRSVRPWSVHWFAARHIFEESSDEQPNDDHGRPSADAGQALTSPPASNDDSPSCGCHFAPLAIDRSD